MPAELNGAAGGTSQVVGVYISIPFCRFKCTYCNFASGVFRALDLAPYLEALQREWQAACGAVHAALAGRGRPARAWTPAPQGIEGVDNACGAVLQDCAGPPGPAFHPSKVYPGQDTAALVDSVYLGGGTPSILSPEQMASLFDGLRRTFRIAADAEITLEAAPGSITPALAAAWRECGVNRASLGVQSFIERELRAVGRPHSARTVEADVALLRAAGIINLGFDLIAGLPYQTAASWEESLGWLGRLAPQHASVYLLEVDDDSRLGAEALAGGARYSARELPDDDSMADFYSHAIERLREFGLRQYEISNFSQPGFRSRHNLKYWEGAPYLGFGLDAHSFDGAERWANTDSLEEYLARAARGESPVCERYRVDERRRAEERIFLGLRRNEGVELPPDSLARYRREIDELTASGLLESVDNDCGAVLQDCAGPPGPAFHPTAPKAGAAGTAALAGRGRPARAWTPAPHGITGVGKVYPDLNGSKSGRDPNTVRLRLTDRGRLLSNEVLANFIE